MGRDVLVRDAVTYDVCIVGGGLVGSVLALALGQGGVRVALIDRSPMGGGDGQDDPRTTAYAYASIQLFKNVGLWDILSPHGAFIREIRVSDGDSRAFIHYDGTHTGGAPMGVILENSRVKRETAAALLAEPLVDVYAPAPIRHWHQDAGQVTLTLDDGQVINSAVLVGADGRGSTLRTDAGLKSQRWDYGQTALVGTIGHTFPHEDRAFEHFLPIGPLAILPMAGGYQSAFVWSLKTNLATAYQALGGPDFAQKIGDHFAPTLGQITLESPITAYPLSGVIVPRVRQGRLVLVGDSAHVIHPVAGQGLNLGLRDGALLYDLLTMAKRTGLDLGSDTVIGGYENQRRADIWSMTAITDGLVRVFSTDLPPIRSMRRIGLWCVNRLPFVKKRLVDRARGLFHNRGTLLR